MDGSFWLIGLIVIGLVIIGPILGTIAFFRTKRIQPDNRLELTNQVQYLTQRVAALERALAGPSTSPAATVASTPAQPPAPEIATPPTISPQPASSQTIVAPVSISPQPTPRSAAPPTVAQRPILTAPVAHKDEAGFESLVGGRWFHYAGILAMLFGVAFFIKYAFDNHWVGPTGRIAIGVAIGTALVTWSHYLLRSGYGNFSEGITGMGAAVLYLSLWAGWFYYGLFSQSAAFGFMIVVTAAMTAIAVGRNSQRIALLAAIGGVLTPAIVSTGQNHELALFAYLAILDAGLLAIARVRRWRGVAAVQFIATLIYFWGWYSEFYSHAQINLTAFFATVFFVIFTAIPLLRSRRTGELREEETILVPANGLTYLWALYQMLWPDSRWTLTIAVLALAAIHLLMLRLLPPATTSGGRIARMLFAGLALTFATLALPIRLDGNWISVALAVEGALLIWNGFRGPLWGLRAAGLLLYAIVGIRLALIAIPVHRAFWNARFATFAIVVACYAFSTFEWRVSKLELNDAETGVFNVLAVAVNVYGVAALSLETWTFVWHMPQLGIDRWLAQQLALSLVWTVYAIALLSYGIVRQIAPVRWQALVLMAVVVIKVFLYDLSSLDRIYRIMSFVVLGAALLVVSFYYQKRQARSTSEGRQT
jgi:uncharacterized membrane protein